MPILRHHKGVCSMTKSKPKKTKEKPYHIAYYVVDSTPAMRKFKSIKEMDTFLKEFAERYAGEDHYSGTYVDFCITNILGEIKFL